MMLHYVSRRLVLAMSLMLIHLVMVTSQGDAQDACCFEPAYRLQCETVVQPQPVQRFRMTYDTQYVEEEVTSYRPVLKTRMEEREYRVAKPVTETSYREERYTVYKPIVETSYREETVTNTDYVTETREREERVTSYKPVTETEVMQQQYTVQRPVTETQMVQQSYTVQRPVTETQMVPEQVTSYRPVTQMMQQTVDAGGYVPQTTITPGSVQYGLAWNPAAYAVPGPLGIFARVRGAAVAVPQVTSPVAQTQMVYRPNYVTQQIPQTSYVPEVQTVQRPVQVTRMQSEIVTQNVPIQTTRMQSEIVTQKIPVQRTRYVPQTEVRKIPYTVQRPVTRTSTRRVPIQKTRYVAEERVRKIPVQTTRMVYETRREPVTVKYYEQEEVRRKVLRPVTVSRCEPYTTTQMVPQQIVQRLPLSYSDPFSSAIVSGYSSMSPPDQPMVTQPDDTVTRNRMADEGESILERDAEENDPQRDDDAKPRSRLGEIEFGDLERGVRDDLDAVEEVQPGQSGQDDLDSIKEPSSRDALRDLFPESPGETNSFDPQDDVDTGRPELTPGRQTGGPLPGSSIRSRASMPKFRAVHFRLKMNPLLLRSI